MHRCSYFICKWRTTNFVSDDDIKISQKNKNSILLVIINNPSAAAI